MLISAVEKGYREKVLGNMWVCVYEREEVMYIVKHMYGPAKASARWWHLGKELNRKHAENQGKRILVRGGGKYKALEQVHISDVCKKCTTAMDLGSCCLGAK